MPTYQYACTDCDHSFEKVQSFSEDSLTECPECEGRLRKVFNAVGVVFKGSGFYRTDSRSESNGRDKGRSGESSKTTAGSSSSDGASSSDAAGSSSKPAAPKPTTSKPKAEAGAA